MEPLTADILNRKFGSMRKEVLKAIVHHIHGLTRRIENLRTKKGTEEQKKSNNAKADKYVAEILVLKKMKPHQVSLFALSHPSKSELSQIIAKQVISVETKAIAKLCLRDNVIKEVNDFISKYSDSLELLNDLLSKWCSKEEKSNKKKKDNVKSKQTESKKKNGFNETEENYSDSNESVPQLVSISQETSSKEASSSESDIEECELKDESSSEGIFSESHEEEESEEEVSEEEESEEEFESGKIESEKVINYKKEKNLNEFKRKSKGNISDHNDDTSSKKIKFSNSGSDENEDSTFNSKEKSERIRVDPFFKTKDDSEYLTYCDVKKIVPDEPNERLSSGKENDDANDQMDSFRGRGRGAFRGGSERGSFRGGFRRGSFNDGNRGSFRGRGVFRGSSERGSFRGNRGRGTFRGNSERGSFRGNSERGSFRGNRGRGTFRGGSDRGTFRGRSERGSFRGRGERGSFRGSSDRGSHRGGQDRYFNMNRKDNLGDLNRAERRSESIKQSEGVQLHPSWEAKKTLNKSLLPFQGKKTTFDE